MIEPFEKRIAVARAALMRASRLLQDEIRNYPTPISGCDAQFNHLLGERQKVSAALRNLDTAVFVPTPRSPTQVAGIESR